jgi:hypothetical protein
MDKPDYPLHIEYAKASGVCQKGTQSAYELSKDEVEPVIVRNRSYGAHASQTNSAVPNILGVSFKSTFSSK